MEHLPTKNDVIALGVATYDGGVETHTEELLCLVRVLRTVAPGDRLLEIVSDLDAPGIVRMRALARIAADWPKFCGLLTEQARSEFDSAFDELLVAWRHHQVLRETAAPIKDLSASRTAIDELRVQVGTLRSRLADRLARADEGVEPRCA